MALSSRVPPYQVQGPKFKPQYYQKKKKKKKQRTEGVGEQSHQILGQFQNRRDSMDLWKNG
jgi:hypothetical protein